MCPTGKNHSEKVQAGVIYLSHKSGLNNEAVPIVPLKITKVSEGKLRSSFHLEIKPPITPKFISTRPSKDEIMKYSNQLQKAIHTDD